MGIEGSSPLTKKTSLRNLKLWSFNSCNGNVGTEWYNSWIFQLHPNIPLVSNWSTIASPLETKRVGQLNEHFHPFLWQRCADVFFFPVFNWWVAHVGRFMVVGFQSENISRGFALLGILLGDCFDITKLPSPKFIIQSQGWRGKYSQDVTSAVTWPSPNSMYIHVYVDTYDHI